MDAAQMAELNRQMADAQAHLQDLNLDLQLDIQSDIQTRIQDAMQDKILGKMDDKMAETNAKMAEAYAKSADKYKYNYAAPLAAYQQRAATYSMAKGGSDESLYNNGLSAINNHQYDQALSEFNNVVTRNGIRAEGALYWKAYVLTKLGRAAEAQSAIDTLRKTYPNGRWMDDAKVLELEVKQTKGPVSPDAEADDDIKLLALNGLMQADPEKALPQVANLLKGAHSPNLKRQALFVIAQNNTPKAQQMLEQIARGGNPDLQVRAIAFMSEKRNPNTPQILLEIYTSTTDPAVKNAILQTFGNNRDKDRLMQVLRTEKDGSLRTMAIGRLGDVDGQPQLWQIYASETTSEGKIAVLNAMSHNGDMAKLTDVAKNDKDPKVRQKAIEIISEQDGGSPSDALVALYGGEQDEKVKQTIVDHLGSGRGRGNNCKPLVDIAKSEKDIKLKLRLVQRLSSMTTSCPAATEYLTELLNK